MEYLAPTHDRRPARRWAALALACCAFTGGARAADPLVAIEVTPLPDTVNLRVAGSTTQAAYRVVIVNNSTNVLNDVRFSAHTRIDPATSPARTNYVEDSSAQCGLAPNSQTELTCSFGQLRGKRQTGQNVTSFVVVFEAPTAGERLFLDWSATYQEGSTDNNGSSSPTNDSQNSDEPGKAVFTKLVTSAQVDDKRLRSYFAASTGAQLQTSTGVPSGPPSEDRWATLVRIPTGVADQAQIVEDSEGNSCSPVLPVCVRSAVSVPGSFVDTTPGNRTVDFLVITVRRDASTIPSGAKIDSAPLLYEPGSLDADGAFHPSFPNDPAFPVRIKLCSQIGGAPSLPTAGASPAEAAQQKRCIKSFQAYPKNNKAPPGLEGDWEWVIWAIDNGRISF
jgi:hypothetical protein